MPLNINSTLAPSSPAIPYLLEDKYVKGGFRSVADITARNAIPNGARKLGMLVYVTSENQTYTLLSSLTNWELQPKQAIQESNIDTNPQAAMLVGAFGLGSTAVSITDDLDLYRNFTCFVKGSNLPNSPFSGLVSVSVVVGDGAVQTAYSPSTNETQVRYFSNDEWTVWQKNFTGFNQLDLGTTSTSAKTALELTKADVGLSDVDNTSDLLKPISTAQQSALDLKATTTYVDQQLSTKLDLDDYTAEQLLKADLSYVDAQLLLKADLTYVDSELADKADNTYVDSQLLLKADASALSSKLDTSVYTAGIATKADLTYVDSQLGNKVDNSTFTSALAAKVDTNTFNSAIAASAYGIKYTWANLAARNAQSGMIALEQGVQQDTRIVYSYDGSAWQQFYALDGVHNHDTEYLKLTGGALSGSLDFSGSASRITGDFSNVSPNARTMFQTNVPNTASRVGVVPNGSATTSNFGAHNNSDATNASYVRMTATSTDTRIESNFNGTGAYLPLLLQAGGINAVTLGTDGSTTLAGKLNTLASTATVAGANLPHGVAPTTPTNGDVWTTSSGIFARINGVTSKLDANNELEWRNTYSVNATTFATLLWYDGAALPQLNPLATGARSDFICTAVTLGTATVTRTVARFTFDGTNWQITQVSNLSQLTNHPIFSLNGGVPSVNTAHASLYSVSVVIQDNLFSTVLGNYLPLSGGTLTGNLAIPDGALNTPSVAFASSPTTGLFSPGANKLAVSLGSDNGLRIEKIGTGVVTSRIQITAETTGVLANGVAISGGVSTDPTRSGGRASLSGGNGGSSNGTSGGPVILQAGSGTSVGGNVNINPGSALGDGTTAAAGSILMQGGYSSPATYGTGGYISIQGGGTGGIAGATTPGGVQILSGTNYDNTVRGTVSISSHANNSLLFQADGNVVFTATTLDFNNSTLTNVKTPASGTEAANKTYVDTASSWANVSSKPAVITSLAGLSTSTTGNVKLTNGVASLDTTSYLSLGGGTLSGDLTVNAAVGQSSVWLSQAGTVNGRINAAGGAGTDIEIASGRFITMRPTTSFKVVGGSTEYLTVLTTGKVGVNQNNPLEALDVVGNVKATGTFTGNGSGLTNITAATANTVTAAAQPAITSVGTLTSLSVSGALNIGAKALSPGGTSILDYKSDSATVSRINLNNNASTFLGAVYADTTNGVGLVGPSGSLAISANSSAVSIGSVSIAMNMNGVGTYAKAQRGNVVALTDAATITPDFSLSNNYSLTIGGARTLATPTNLAAGQSGIINITQDGTGSRTLAFSTAWKFSGGTIPSLSTAANAVDALSYYVESGSRITAALLKDNK